MIPDILERKYAAATQKIEILERMIEEGTRDLYLANENLRASHDFLKEVFRSMTDMLLVIGVNGEIQQTNAAVSDLLHYTEDQLRGRSLETVFGNRDGETDAHTWFRNLLAGGSVRNSEKVWLTRHGEHLPVSVSASIVGHADGSRKVIVVARDITEMKAYSSQLERSNKELEQFAYVASHDLQEPLRMITSYVQLLSKRYKGKLDGDADTFIAFAVDGAFRMKNLINDLLTYSRIGTHGKPLAETACETVLDRILANLQIAVQESGAAVTHDPLPTVMADQTQLEQLFQNLVGNAIKFKGDETPRVHLSAERKGQDWLFSVSDNGIGIDPKYAERIFVIFQRLHTSQQYPGTGIGLAVCKKIVERHGGRLWVESRAGKGSTFHFTIPIAEGSHD